MLINFDTPWLLSGLLLMMVPLLRTGIKSQAYPWLAILPEDTLSSLLSVLIRIIGMAAIGLLILGLSGVYLKEQRIERIGRGAHIVLLLDRSNSMDTTFAGKAPMNDQEESKSAAARRLLTEFIDKRSHDLMGIAEFSTAPLFVMPLTENKQALHAAIDATATPALAYTHISKGLAMALSFFDEQPTNGTRIVVLVSDGAAAIDSDSEQALRTLIKDQHIRLYWVFLRTSNSPGIHEKPENTRDDNAQALPEKYLHLFFSSLNVPYQVYEAESPEGLQAAIDDIDKLENRPLHYFERLPKQDLSGLCYQWASLMIALLLVLKLCEVNRS
ncbi:VWA domain-containing protein [Methylicorpusculum oleiharenae]|uniref:vWA domain-containing protein n=1 Tax=Methylicorpusculum oleiharenae TaxID=1338687 RepID=UPI001E5E3084|nr:VWA domain-containing protein [Methylicorpusculum oleiharenae]